MLKRREKSEVDRSKVEGKGGEDGNGRELMQLIQSGSDRVLILKLER